MKKPSILITNDDGVHAPGIKHLWKALAAVADVTVVAPAIEQSGVGLAITLRHPLSIERLEWGEGVNVFSVSGTPADCVKIALNVILEKQPDLIFSGINRGSNEGRNVLYSGTVGGVIEGLMHNIPGIALSCRDYMDSAYESVVPHIPEIMRYVLEHPLPHGTFLNINFPREVKGLKLARQGRGLWMENPEKRSHPAGGHSYYWLGARVAEFQEEEGSDVFWLEQGYAAAVPVHVGELTDHNHLARHKDHFEAFFLAEKSAESVK